MNCRIGLLLAFLLACGDDDAQAVDAGPPDPDPACLFARPVDVVSDPAIHTPRWAFEPWISKDISDAEDTRAFVAGFRERDIPVGAVVIDSPWETNYNTFVPSESRYPGFAGLVTELRQEGIRTILWTTSQVNTSSFDLEEGGDEYAGASPNHAEGLACDFFVNRDRIDFWWKGTGASLDFFDPEARAWWHRQQDLVLDMGIAGWKLDFGEEWIRLDVLDTAIGEVSRQQYSEEYYADFYRYGAARLGTEEFVTMVRPWDESYGFPGRFFARPEHAPVGWVGDNRRDWVGLVDALDQLFRSALAGYVVIGSDVGGYLDFDDEDSSVKIPADTLVFARWVAMGALTPFMQLHGRANLAPWTVADHVEETVTLYRYWATLHSELVPFFYSLAEEAYAGGPVIMRPLSSEVSEWAGDWRYQLGEAFLVAPVTDAANARDVELPAGTWYDWWTGVPVAGGQTVSVDVSDRARIPLFVRQGAIVPLAVRNDVTGLGDADSTGALTVAIWPAAEETTFRVHDDDGEVTVIGAKIGEITLSRALQPVILRVRGAAGSVTVDGEAVAFETVGDVVVIRLPTSTAPRTVALSPPA